MTTKPKWFQTTAIDYPNALPHIGTAFEKLGADVQARYRRMEGYDVTFLMGNDENTLKVADKAKQLGLDTQAYCDDMARQFREVWDALDISYDVFIQTSHERHKQCCRKFIQKVYDNGYIYKGDYSGWFCPGCEEFKSDKVHAENQGQCPNHKRALVRRAEPCYKFKLSAFQDRLLAFLKENPDFVQPESRRNEMIGFIEAEGLEDLNISRYGKEWGIPLPFDPEFTTFVWFDALLTYITGIGYGDDEATFHAKWPCDTHFIGKDITRFHCHIWPAMLWAAGLEAPKRVFSHGFVYFQGDKIGKERLEELKAKGLGYLLVPMEIIKKFSAEAFRYYFMKECPYPSDGNIDPDQFIKTFNSDLANTLGNLLSRTITIPLKSLGGVLPGTANRTPETVTPEFDPAKLVAEVRARVEACEYSQALQAIMSQLLYPVNKYIGDKEPWKVVKTDPSAAALILHNVLEGLRMSCILLKPFIPRSAEAIYTSFGFTQAWADVAYADAAAFRAQAEDLRVTAELLDGKPKPLFPRIS
ncbi:MAG: methionine--tRNA ligase [Fimbriiglobus sp.]